MQKLLVFPNTCLSGSLAIAPLVTACKRLNAPTCRKCVLRRIGYAAWVSMRSVPNVSHRNAIAPHRYHVLELNHPILEYIIQIQNIPFITGFTRATTALKDATPGDK